MTNEFEPYLANYIFTNGEKSPVTVFDIARDGRAHAIWHNNGYKNLIPLDKLERISDWKDDVK